MKFTHATRPALIGMIHLPPLLGSPGFRDRAWVTDSALRDLEALQSGGVDAVMVENFGDVPFHAVKVPTAVVAHFAAVAAKIRENCSVLLGINLLRNDALGAMAIAASLGANFIRVNVLTGARLTDQGIIEGNAAELHGLRRELGAAQVSILADIDVKHSAPLVARPLAWEVEETIERGLADALIVSGAGTGKVTDLEKVKQVHSHAKGKPILVGSGVTLANAKSFSPYVAGLIVGTSLKENEDVRKPVCVSRVKALVSAL